MAKNSTDIDDIVQLRIDDQIHFTDIEVDDANMFWFVIIATLMLRQRSSINTFFKNLHPSQK